MHVFACCATAQQIHALAAELARARPGEDELLARLALDQQVHHFEQRG